MATPQVQGISGSSSWYSGGSSSGSSGTFTTPDVASAKAQAAEAVIKSGGTMEQAVSAAQAIPNKPLDYNALQPTATQEWIAKETGVAPGAVTPLMVARSGSPTQAGVSDELLKLAGAAPKTIPRQPDPYAGIREGDRSYIKTFTYDTDKGPQSVTGMQAVQLGKSQGAEWLEKVTGQKYGAPTEVLMETPYGRQYQTPSELTAVQGAELTVTGKALTFDEFGNVKTSTQFIAPQSAITPDYTKEIRKETGFVESTATLPFMGQSGPEAGLPKLPEGVNLKYVKSPVEGQFFTVNKDWTEVGRNQDYITFKGEGNKLFVLSMITGNVRGYDSAGNELTREGKIDVPIVGGTPFVNYGDYKDYGKLATTTELTPFQTKALGMLQSGLSIFRSKQKFPEGQATFGAPIEYPGKQTQESLFEQRLGERTPGFEKSFVSLGELPTTSRGGIEGVLEFGSSLIKPAALATAAYSRFAQAYEPILNEAITGTREFSKKIGVLGAPTQVILGAGEFIAQTPLAPKAVLTSIPLAYGLVETAGEAVVGGIKTGTFRAPEFYSVGGEVGQFTRKSGEAAEKFTKENPFEVLGMAIAIPLSEAAIAKGAKVFSKAVPLSTEFRTTGKVVGEVYSAETITGAEVAAGKALAKDVGSKVEAFGVLEQTTTGTTRLSGKLGEVPFLKELRFPTPTVEATAKTYSTGLTRTSEFGKNVVLPSLPKTEPLQFTFKYQGQNVISPFPSEGIKGAVKFGSNVGETYGTSLPFGTRAATQIGKEAEAFNVKFGGLPSEGLQGVISTQPKLFPAPTTIKSGLGPLSVIQEGFGKAEILQKGTAVGIMRIGGKTELITGEELFRTTPIQNTIEVKPSFIQSLKPKELGLETEAWTIAEQDKLGFQRLGVENKLRPEAGGTQSGILGDLKLREKAFDYEPLSFENAPSFENPRVFNLETGAPFDIVGTAELRTAPGKTIFMPNYQMAIQEIAPRTRITTYEGISKAFKPGVLEQYKVAGEVTQSQLGRLKSSFGFETTGEGVFGIAKKKGSVYLSKIKGVENLKGSISSFVKEGEAIGESDLVLLQKDTGKITGPKTGTIDTSSTFFISKDVAKGGKKLIEPVQDIVASIDSPFNAPREITGTISLPERTALDVKLAKETLEPPKSGMRNIIEKPTETPKPYDYKYQTGGQGAPGISLQEAVQKYGTTQKISISELESSTSAASGASTKLIPQVTQASELQSTALFRANLEQGIKTGLGGTTYGGYASILKLKDSRPKPYEPTPFKGESIKFKEKEMGITRQPSSFQKQTPIQLERTKLGEVQSIKFKEPISQKIRIAERTSQLGKQFEIERPREITPQRQPQRLNLRELTAGKQTQIQAPKQITTEKVPPSPPPTSTPPFTPPIIAPPRVGSKFTFEGGPINKFNTPKLPSLRTGGQAREQYSDVLSQMRSQYLYGKATQITAKQASQFKLGGKVPTAEELGGAKPIRGSFFGKGKGIKNLMSSKKRWF